MNLQQISDSLPNGFHDSELQSLAFDFAKNEARLALNIWVGDLGQNDTELREARKRAELVLTSLGYWLFEPPSSSAFPLGAAPLWIDIGPIDTLKQAPAIELPPTAPGSSAHWMFIKELNSLFYFSAQQAELHWADDALSA